MARPRARDAFPNRSVFVNCPFDADYRQCFEAILFTVTAAGYDVRCALEDDNAGDVRFSKLCELIRDSDWTIHDLSRTQSGDDGLPRFNMPFELGLMMGARTYGQGRQLRKNAVIMITKKFTMPRFLSDLGGNDPAPHDNDPRRVIEIVRNHLHNDPTGTILPGATHTYDLLKQFLGDLPKLAAEAKLTETEVDPYRGYRNFMDMLRSFCATIPKLAT